MENGQPLPPTLTSWDCDVPLQATAQWEIDAEKNNGQLGEILVNFKGLNKLTVLGMPVRQRLS